MALHRVHCSGKAKASAALFDQLGKALKSDEGEDIVKKTRVRAQAAARAMRNSTIKGSVIAVLAAGMQR